jgi:hypothetical protein
MGTQIAGALDYSYALLPALHLEVGAQLYILAREHTFIIPFVEQEFTQTQIYMAIQMPIRLRYQAIKFERGNFSVFTGCMPEYHSNEFHFHIYSAGAGMSVNVFDGLNLFGDAMTRWWYSSYQQARFWNPAIRAGFNVSF